MIRSESTSSLVIINEEFQAITFVKATLICYGVREYEGFGPSDIRLECYTVRFLPQ